MALIFSHKRFPHELFWPDFALLWSLICISTTSTRPQQRRWDIWPTNIINFWAYVFRPTSIALKLFLFVKNVPNQCCQERYEKNSEFIHFKAQMIVLNLNSILVGLIRFFLWSLKDYYKKCTEKRTLTTIIAFGLNFKLPHKSTRILGKENQNCQLWLKMSSK